MYYSKSYLLSCTNKLSFFIMVYKMCVCVKWFQIGTDRMGIGHNTFKGLYHQLSDRSGKEGLQFWVCIVEYRVGKNTVRVIACRKIKIKHIIYGSFKSKLEIPGFYFFCKPDTVTRTEASVRPIEVSIEIQPKWSHHLLYFLLGFYATFNLMLREQL